MWLSNMFAQVYFSFLLANFLLQRSVWYKSTLTHNYKNVFNILSFSCDINLMNTMSADKSEISCNKSLDKI